MGKRRGQASESWEEGAQRPHSLVPSFALAIDSLIYGKKTFRFLLPQIKGTSSRDRLQGDKVSLVSMKGSVGVFSLSLIFKVLLSLQCPALREHLL